MKVYWKIRVKGSGSCTYEWFQDAWEDWKSHDGEWRIVYPVFMSRKAFLNLPEHNGW
jgi:hypothetical protein